jgi:fatty acid desaturase
MAFAGTVRREQGFGLRRGFMTGPRISEEFRASFQPLSQPDRSRLVEAHRPRWSGALTWLAFLAAFGLFEGLLLASYRRGPIWLTALLVLPVAHLMHAHLLVFHEAAHGSLCPGRRRNDAAGLFLGTFSFMSLTLFRAAHHTHHAYLASERDEELWPFVLPGTPRWARRLAAVLELTVGLVYTPLLFLRSFLRPGSPVQDRARRLRVWAELGLIAVVWGSVAAATWWWGLWPYVLVLYLAPAVLAGNLQSLRKYVEHMGLAGSTPLDATRNIVPRGVLGRLVAFSLFNEPYHVVHHVYPRLPQECLPEFAGALAPAAGAVPPLPGYRSALGPVLRSLRDPRVGAQWLQGSGASRCRGP